MIRIITTLAPWLIIGGLLVPSWLESREPAENWLRVGSITVSDSQSGEPIVMSVRRVISRPFVGSWVATIRRFEEDGLVVACTATGTSAYRTEAILPKPLTLDWWTHPVRCSLAPGRYRLDTVWSFDLASGATKSITAESNVFQVR